MDATAWFDLTVAIVLLITAIRGALRGVFWELATVGAIVLCFAFAQELSAHIAPHVPLGQPLNRWISLLVLYVAFSFVSFSIARVLRGWIQKLQLREYDRHLGMLVGVLKGGVLLLIVLCFLVTIVPASRDIVLRSRSGRIAAVVLEAIHSALPEDIHEILHPYLHNLDVGDGGDHAHPGGSDRPQAHHQSGHTVPGTGADSQRGSSSESPRDTPPLPAERNGNGAGAPTASLPPEDDGPESAGGPKDRPRPAPPTLEQLLRRILQIGVGTQPHSSPPGESQASAGQPANGGTVNGDTPSAASAQAAPPESAPREDVVEAVSELLARLLVDAFLNRIDDPDVRASWKAAWERATPQQRRELVDRLQNEPPEKAAAEFRDWVRQVR